MNGIVLTPRQDEGERMKIRVSREDADKVTRGEGYKGRVTDLDTNEEWDIYGAACSLPTCFCDARAVPVEEDKDNAENRH